MEQTSKLRDILYIDDEIDNFTVFKSAFRRSFNIHLASSAAEGLVVLQNHKINIIVTDQRMPGTTGLELLEQVTELYPNTFRIILTGYGDIDAINQAIFNGVVHVYVTKPWKKEELAAILDSAPDFFD